MAQLVPIRLETKRLHTGLQLELLDRGLERWLSSQEHWILFQRTHVESQHPHGSSHLPVIQLQAIRHPYTDRHADKIPVHIVNRGHFKTTQPGKGTGGILLLLFCIFTAFIHCMCTTWRSAHVEVRGQLGEGSSLL